MIVKLSDENIKLVPFDSSDLALFLALSTCSKIMAHVAPSYSHNEAVAEFERRSKPWSLESDGWLSLSITEIASNEKVGCIALKIINHQAKIAEVGFLLKSGTQGKGFASRALKLLKSYAFNDLALNKLVGFCSVQNSASYKLLEKSGFVREGCFRQNTLLNDQYVDDYAYGLCKSALLHATP